LLGARGTCLPSRLTFLHAAFELNAGRERKESILGRFDLPVIERYFPEYPREMTARLRDRGQA